MFRNFHNPRGSSAHARNPLPRWRTVFIALVLALTIGNAGQIAPAQAAPAHVPVKVYMDVVSPKSTVCAGKEANYEVRVFTPPTTIVGIEIDRYALPGIKVEAFSQDKSVGDFLGTKKGIRTRITGASDELLDDEPTPHTAYFTFKAKKAGKTTLYFEGVAHGQYVSFNVPVRVINCKYKVITTSQMSKCYPHGCIKFLGVIVEGRVTADETGYIFTGTAPVVWLSTSAIPNCGAVNSLGISQVEMRGNLNESGQLLLKLNYGTVAFSEVITCPRGTGGSSPPVSVSPLKVTMPPASTGVAVKLDQTLSGGAQTIVGSANVYVIPLDGAK